MGRPGQQLRKFLAMGKKEILAGCLDRARIIDVCNTVSRTAFTGQCVSILAYHRVFDIDPCSYPFDAELVSASEEAFDRQMRYVARNFDVITFSELRSCLGAGSIPKRPLIITFDDGYMDNYTVAFPVLKGRGLTATIFLATSHMDTGEPFWFEKVSYWIKKTGRKEIRLSSGRDVHEYRLSGDRLGAIKDIQDLLKSVDEAGHSRLMASLEHETGVSIRQEDLSLAMPLSWKEVKEMSSAGIEFGSHSSTHLNVAKVTDERLWAEIDGSRRSIEEAINRPVAVFSYPFGGINAFSRRTGERLRQAGYEFAVSYLDGINRVGSMDAFEMKRVHVERYDSFSLFKGRLCLARLFT
jgi:peptidoglycan/xylan/chitin deacetylase (PgdA/CDA1 family)